MTKNIYQFSCEDSSGQNVDLSDFRGKTLLIVNTASQCGFTPQYKGLEQLQNKFSNEEFSVLAFPCNQFGGQEPGSNKEIKEFCETNFNITFPMTEKVNVKGDDAHPIYKWAKENFGNSSVPKWNFHKILINKEGKVENTYSSFTKPLSNKIITKIESIL